MYLQVFHGAISEWRGIIIVSSVVILMRHTAPLPMTHIPNELRFIYVGRKTKMCTNSFEMLSIYVCDISAVYTALDAFYLSNENG